MRTKDGSVVCVFLIIDYNLFHIIICLVLLRQLISHFWGLILSAIVLIAIGIVLPLIGFVCCCCCSSNKSSRAKHSRSYSSSSTSPARRNGHKKKRYKVDGTCDPCVRSICAI